MNQSIQKKFIKIRKGNDYGSVLLKSDNISIEKM